MIIKCVIEIVLLIYVMLSILAYVLSKDIEKTKVKSIVYLLVGVLEVLTIGMFNSVYSMIPLAGVLLILWSCAVHNGYKLYGKPNWKHHIIRASVSVGMYLLYVIVWASF
ncbi:hypothetical protein [Anaeromicropila herbilytica]|uniref:Uncharacterized protein n=1 Tax=Anaeromicropila herbilytica TaxID=2785025 RepID=A0A7R7EJF6_9FIRM|nr:hypothetical protein [Anaeromicropila herbilytica]BCN29880.1 hypothetical protein bsdtb5_11750 [Anaeromicropila herbilytica]